MNMENLRDTNRLETFYDAIIAIIVTVLVLELPQPETATIAGILALKISYFNYLISFLVNIFKLRFYEKTQTSLN
ncbi:TMEM175 family protein [Methanobrevibacter sp.]|uniref:TMEM175 family protein n=1 Tax=Methanobrevibacter sp. TaxID=66852 RepID=UPI0025EDDC14|nr:TMEM175 family protein [Methanobrevibacter sp.]